MIRTLTKDELLNLMAGLPPSVMAMDEAETITTLAATVIEQQREIERLRDALDWIGYAPMTLATCRQMAKAALETQ